ncbi:MAG: hypothetical protein M0Z63_09260 [Actinomycetota bacterium]|jgi:hypothetical protein|nr:hypothetical protein [Actinomycetota bacterium]
MTTRHATACPGPHRVVGAHPGRDRFVGARHTTAYPGPHRVAGAALGTAR